MEKLDLKDRKILYQLDLDSRQSFSSIGRKVGLSKDIVASRVKKLQEKGIIVRFNTLIDEFKLGFTSLRFYLNYQYITPEIKKEIIDHFASFKHTEIVATLEGSIDQNIFMIGKNVTEIYSFCVFFISTQGLKFFVNKYSLSGISNHKTGVGTC